MGLAPEPEPLPVTFTHNPHAPLPSYDPLFMATVPPMLATKEGREGRSNEHSPAVLEP